MKVDMEEFNKQLREQNIKSRNLRKVRDYIG